MDSNLQIVEKPDWVSWEEIHEVLVQAHAENRAKGINMRKPSLPGEEIKKEVGDDGVMLVALDGKKVVGTAAILVKESNTWYNNGKFGYLCFAAILPAYNGKGLYKHLCCRREEIAKGWGLDKVCFDTHHDNSLVIKINKAQWYKCVDIKVLRDHWNIVMCKWLDRCPFSNRKCWFEFYKRYIYYMSRKWMKLLLKREK